MHHDLNTLGDQSIDSCQSPESILLWRTLSHIENGFYINIGSNYPLIDPVTQFFYNNRWRGINVEPLEGGAHQLEKFRPLDINLQVAVNMDLALNQVFIDHLVKEIHFLKIHWEGRESEVLESLKLKNYRPWIIIINSKNPITFDFLLGNQYQFVSFDGINRFYLAVEHSQLRDLLCYHFDDLDIFINLKCKNLEANNLRLLSDNLILKSKLKQLNSTLEKIYCSRSWWVIIPLRFASNLLKKVHKNNNAIVGNLVTVLLYFAVFLKNIHIIKKLMGYIKFRFPRFYQYFKQKYKPLHYPLSIEFIKQFPFAFSLAKKIYYQFPIIAKYCLKLTQKIDSRTLAMKFSFDSKKYSTGFQQEINLFLNDLKLEIETHRKKNEIIN